MPRHFELPAISILTLATLVGCSSDPEPQPLSAGQFSRPTDEGGALPPGRPPEPVKKPAPTELDKQQATEAYKTVAEQVKPATSQPTTSSTSAPEIKAFADGQFINLGGVIAEVNGTPIFADDVLRQIVPVLAGRAKDLDQSKFRMAAAQEIGRQVDEMIRAEVEYAAADRNTTAEDKTMANRLTEQWRSNIITQYGGAIENARAAFREQGRSFEDAQKEQFRVNLVRVYYTKKLFPRVEISAASMRRFYEANREKLFTLRDNATFRLIKVSPAEVGSDAEAKKQIDDLHARALKGEDFEKLAEYNKDEMLLKSKGLMPPMDRGAWKLEAVENAIWATDVGGITPVIKDGNDYHFAKVLDKTIGRTKAFSEDEVQRKISDTLRAEQFAKMRADMESQLRRDSVVTKNPQMYENALNMAMQNYGRWRDQ
jgi:parvulin-like peptidyl-prolyl isomerase